MILSLISVGLIVVGIILMRINLHYHLNWKDYLTATIGIISIWCGVVISIVCLVGIICSHVTVNKDIHDAEMKRESIIRQIDAVNNDYEDVSRAKVIQKVYDWNQEVYDKKYWTDSKWTNWLHSKKYADSLEYIDLEQLEQVKEGK